MRSAGRIQEVFRERLGTTVAVAAPTGTQVISVVLTADFDDSGGQLQHGPTGDVYSYTKTDPDAETITLSAALPGGKSFAVDDALYVYPAARDYYAWVLADDVDDAPIRARLTHDLRFTLAPGVRQAGTGETAVLEHDGEDWILTDVPGSTPQVTGPSATFTDITINPGESDAVPLTIFDTLGTGGNWFEAKTSAGLRKTIIANYGGMQSSSGFMARNPLASALGEYITVAGTADIGAVPAIYFGDGLDDTRLRRTGAKTLEVQDDVGGLARLIAFEMTVAYITGAGKRKPVDGDFPITPGNGTIAVVQDTTAGVTILCARGGGTWKGIGLSAAP